jgi:hypothetical protein
VIRQLADVGLQGQRMAVLLCEQYYDFAEELADQYLVMERSDMLLSTMRHYVESMGGKLELVAKFPDRPSVVIDHLGGNVTLNKRVSAGRRARATA